MTATMGRPTATTASPQPQATVPRPARPGLRRHVPKIFAAILWVVAVVSALAAVAGALTDEVRPIGELLIPVPPNLAYAAFVAVLAVATARRKRVAYWVLVVYFALSLVTSAALLARIEGWSGIGVAAAALVLLVLFVSRREFHARMRPGGLPLAIGVLVVLVAASIGLGYLLVDRYISGPGERLAYAAEHVLGGAVVPDLGWDGSVPGWVTLVLGLMGAIALLAALLTLRRRARRSAAVLPADDEQRIRTLLARYGDRDSLGYFATRRDKAVVFSPTGKSAITYRVVKGVCLAGGDPIGDPEAWGPVVDAWMARARGYGWTPAVLAASEEGAIAYARAGLEARHVGDEATLLSGEFTLDGRSMRPVRQAVQRAERAGYTAQVRRQGEVSDEELRTAATLAAAWRDTGMPGALGRLGDPDDGRCVLVEAFDGDGARRAMLSLSPWGERGLSLDLIRHDPVAADGMTEFLVAALMREALRLGVDRVSLGVAADRGAFGQGSYPANARYQPQWTPRYLCCARSSDLARVERAAAVPAVLATASRPVPPEVTAPEVTADVPDQIQVRHAKRERLRAGGVDPYPAGFHRSDNIVAVMIRHEGLPPDSRTGDLVSVAGRVVLLRDHGGVCFATVRDWTGDIQVMVECGLGGWRSTVDLGDHVGVRGEVVTSKHGELSVRAESWQITAKCLRPLPDKRRGLADPEARVRQRYLDLVTSAEARDLLRARSAAVHSLRETLVDRGYLEVETPVLQRVHGGANARPFTTYINAYDTRLYLRGAPKLHLKRLAVGGVERVFELGRAFRNEGVDCRHNPEFTLLEAYQAYADHQTMLLATQALVQRAALAVYGSTVAYQPGADGTLIEYDLSGDWPAVPVNQALSQALGESVTAETGLFALRRMSDSAGVPYDPRWGRGAVLLAMYERLVEARTTTPTFYLDFPVEAAPLARAHRADPRLAERWDLVAFGTGVGTGYSALIDPVEQRRRLTDQSLLAAGGDPEAMDLDEDFLQALEYAMPPTGGLGLGVDRLLMLLTGRSIRETLPFPLVRDARRSA